jgi:hypothetical protein
MTDLVDHIRQILEHHHIDDHSDGTDARCGCGAMDLASHHGRVAQEIVDRFELRKEVVGNKIRYVSAWFDDELTKLEGAE